MDSHIERIFQKVKRFKTWKRKEDLCRHQLSGKDEQEHPADRHMFILLDFLNKCNLRCIMCGNVNRTDEPEMVMPGEIFEKIAKSVFPLSRQVNLSCAYEPFAFRGILDYIRIAIEYRIPKLALTTNATLLTRAKIESIVASGLPYLAISVDGATKTTYESIRIGARFEKILENLQNLQRAKQEMRRETPRIQFNFVLMDKNLEETSSFIQLMAEFKPYKFVFVHYNYTMPTGEQRFRVESTLRQALAECVEHKVLFEEVPNFFLPLEEIMGSYGCNRKDMPEVVVDRCADPWHFMRITPGGDVLMCPNIGDPAGNIFQSDLLDVWHGEIYSNLRERMNQGNPPAHCKSCPYANMGLVQLRQVRDQMEQLITQRISSETRHNQEGE